jgi:multisubunit Na+/H+ antiporter MnhB subunit
MKGLESFIFKPVVKFAFFIINVFALYLLFRGHNLPGGGFIGGLVTGISLVLLSLALGQREMQRIMRVDPVGIAAAGLLIATGTGVIAMIGGGPYLEQFNFYLPHLPLVGNVPMGTPLLFDVGVYLVVVGITAKIIFVLAKSTEGYGAFDSKEELRYSSPVEEPIDPPCPPGSTPREMEESRAD